MGADVSAVGTRVQLDIAGGPSYLSGRAAISALGVSQEATFYTFVGSSGAWTLNGVEVYHVELRKDLQQAALSSLGAAVLAVMCLLKGAADTKRREAGNAGARSLLAAGGALAIAAAGIYYMFFIEKVNSPSTGPYLLGAMPEGVHDDLALKFNASTSAEHRRLSEIHGFEASYGLYAVAGLGAAAILAALSNMKSASPVYPAGMYAPGAYSVQANPPQQGLLAADYQQAFAPQQAYAPQQALPAQQAMPVQQVYPSQ